MISWGLFSWYVSFPSTEHVVFSLWSYDHQPWFSSSSYFLVNPCSHEQVMTYWWGHQGVYAFLMRIFLWHIHRGRRLQVLLTIPWLVLPRTRTIYSLHSFWILPLSFQTLVKSRRNYVCADKILVSLEYPPCLNFKSQHISTCKLVCSS